MTRARYSSHPVLVFLLLAASLPAPFAAAQERLPFDECGTLVSGVECPLFRIADGSEYLLNETGDFEIGQRLRIRGFTEPDCVTFCQQGQGCVRVVSISYCDETLTVCGELVRQQACTMLLDDRGFLLVPDNLGTAQVGDRVRVRGRFDSTCPTVCPANDGCVLDNTIELAGDEPCRKQNDDNDDDVSRICELASAVLMSVSALGLVGTVRRSASRPSACSRIPSGRRDPR